MIRPLHLWRPGTLLLPATLSLFVFAGVADAHAELEDPTPNRNAEVEGTPPEISGLGQAIVVAQEEAASGVDRDAPWDPLVERADV